MNHQLNRSKITAVIEQSQIKLENKNLVNNPGDFAKFIDESGLTDDEKNIAHFCLARQRDIQNLNWFKKKIFQCNICGCKGRTFITCEECVKNYLKMQFNNWTSVNGKYDKEIQEVQEEVPYPALLIEWIPFDELDDIKSMDKGAFSEVFSATWTKGSPYYFDGKKLIREENTKVCLKRLPKDIGYEELKTHFKAKMSGFGIVPCYGVTHDGEGPMLVLQKMHQSLENYLEENRPLPWQEIYNLLWTLSSSLFQLHDAGIIHKDLHLGNIMIDDNGKWNLIDLGLSGVTRNEMRKFYGNGYAAPEVLEGKASHSKESDVYSLAVIMCAVETDFELDFYNNWRPELEKILPDNYPQDYRQIIEDCLSLDPKKRPSSEDLTMFFRRRM